MIYWPAKGPNEIADFYFDFSSVLEAGEILDTEVVTPTGVTVDSEAIDNETKVRVDLSGGTEGSVAQVICSVTTSGGRTFVDVAVLEINGEAISLVDAKTAQKIDSDDEDDVLGIYLRAAIEHVEEVSGKKLTKKIVTQIVNGFPADSSPIKLWAGPVSEILEFKYDDSSSVEQDLVDYRLVGGSENVLIPLSGADWPPAATGQGTVRISYVAGYGPTDRERLSLIQAVILLFGHFNNNREAVALSSRMTNIELPLGVKALIAPQRNPGMA